MKSRLAIVIPAYKREFLDETLRSVVNQTCKDFRLYIGDDTGYGRLKEITDEYTKRIDLVYKAFNENLGLHDLASQWERCIDLTDEEEYIWLFSDDDIMPSDAVERFYKVTDNEEGFDLYRFNIIQISDIGNPISVSTSHPDIEGADGYLYRRLRGETLSAACEYIFTRKTYQRNRGFVHFPLAWCTDDASWYLFSHDRGIKTIGGNPVLWRISEVNISNPSYKNGEKLKAALLFHKWIKSMNISLQITSLISFSIRRQIKILNISLIQLLGKFHLLIGLISLRDFLRLIPMVLKRKNYV